MKKYLNVLVITIVLFAVLSETVWSGEGKETIEVLFNQIQVTLNGEKVEGNNIVYNNTTYVPLREISEMLGLEVVWNQETSTAELASVLIEAEDYQKIPTVRAVYVGGVEGKPSDKWYKIETSYTDMYFHDDAVKLEWVAEDIDQMVEYLYDFRNISWTGERVSIYFLSESNELVNDRNYYGSGYDSKGSITMSYDIPSTMVDMANPTISGERVKFLEDPRMTLLHELAHYVNIPDNLSTLNKWMEEGLANYLSYQYEYKSVDSKRYPDFADRKFVDFVLAGTETYDWQTWVNSIYPDFEYVTAEGAKSALEFEGTMKIHYHMLSGRTPMVRYFETSIIEYFLTTYGKEKMLDLYDLLHEKEADGYIFTKEVENVYGKSLDVLEEEWREFIGASELYAQYK